ncbi:unnamed protein product [Strongylus vulgaris]|uniref:ABC transporter domain-containing protein n=1 Tax=Strongylus vulgaris TaxID=40348 RepID=A0A3P7IVF0_STRVU|nr:unnamed protein product [Strongylus vulgaris]
MGQKYTFEEKMEKVEEVIKDMSLSECENSIIGIPNRGKGISVGEKKRLAFASEILTDPAILFCDEPTSGLDAFMAHQVVIALRLMAEKGKTVVTVIHQPGSQIFHIVSFMALGKTAFHGTIIDLIKFFNSLDDPTLRVPESHNPADFVIKKLSVTIENTDEDLERIKITSVAIGIVNFRTEVYGPTIQNLEGVMYNCVRDMSFLFFFPSINVITSELPVFMRECKARIYSPEAYFIAKSLAEMPQYIALPLIYSVILYWMTGYASGCVFGDEGLAITVMSGFMQAMLVFGGFYINLHNIPMWMRPFSALSFFKYSFETLEINQWTEVTYIKGCTGLLSAGNNTVYCPSETGLVFIQVITSELPVFMRECKARIYSPEAYFIAKSLAEVTIFDILWFSKLQKKTVQGYASGCVFGDEGLAITVMSGFMQAMLVFGGFYINLHNIPMWMRPFSALSFFKYSFETLEINQWTEVSHTATI